MTITKSLTGNLLLNYKDNSPFYKDVSLLFVIKLNKYHPLGMGQLQKHLRVFL